MMFALLFFVWMLFSSVSCQRFGTMMNLTTCRQVNLSVNVDPQSSTFAFNWFLRVDDNTTNINLALVGLNGGGTVGTILQNNIYSDMQLYNISNNPEMLPTNTSPWDTSISFSLPAENTCFRFLVSTVTLEEISPSEYCRPSCNLTVDRHCVDPGNDETCPSFVYCGTSYNRICTDGSAFTSSCPDVYANFSASMLKQCPQPGCCVDGNPLTGNELGGISALSVIGGIGLIIGQLLVIFIKPKN